ncbi:MAG: PTS system mannose/fructose/sorbose family transporter subunit IID [Bombilactobacillus mellifer]|nr:PTS system mannose/fructose/sorbose family transporter subunit IID [Bombilactobacillus mellifer]
MTVEKKQLTKKDLVKVFLHSMAIMCSWNYERQMNMGYMYGMAPVLDRLYADNEEEKKRAYQRHMEFYNCTPQMTPFIMGLTASMEEENANSNGDYDTESISMIKTSLMGPFAGIGDSFFQGTIRIITFGIGLSFAKQGSILGPILAVGLFMIPSLLASYYGTFLGYKSGKTYLAKLYEEGLMDRVMQFASIVGLAVVGGMVASMVDITTPLKFAAGGAKLGIQKMLDQIFPKLLPFGITLGIYYLIKRKINTNFLLIGIIVVGIILGALGIL